MKKLLCFIGGAMLAINLTAQQIKPLSVGDQVPDLTFNHVMNSTKTQFKLSDFKGKLVILDFFGTWCGACIPLVPKLNSLQNKLKDSIQIIVVCDDISNEVVSKFIKKKWNSTTRTIQLPFVLMDSVKFSLFPHRMVPHEVWISPEGKLIAATDESQVTLENLLAAYSNPQIKLKQKVDQMDFNRDLPLLINGNGGNMDRLIHKSIFTKKLEGVPSCAGITLDTINHTRRLYCINSSPVNQLTNVYGISRSKFVLIKNNAVSFIDTMRSSSLKDSMYCYEITIPDTVSKAHYKSIMKNDLEQNLSIKTQLKKVQIPCYILKKIDKPDSHNTSNNKYDKDPNFTHLNVNMKGLTNILTANGFYLVLNETNSPDNIEINLPKHPYKQRELTMKILNEQGLQLTRGIRTVELVTIEKNNHN
ncbi:TlpA family protein disulfide reductase [Arachidicoccus ginsenosidivorans]